MSTDPSGPPWAGLRQEAANYAGEIIRGGALFRLRVAWHRSYQDLLAASPAEETSEAALLGRVLERGRVLISAEAGSGKTWLVTRVAVRAIETSGTLPVLIPLREFMMTDALAKRRNGNLVLSALYSIAIPDPRPVLASQGQVPQLVLIIDGINEVPRNLADSVIAAVDDLARRYPFVSVLLTDRMVRRQIDLDRWALATILPLSGDAVADALHTAALPSRATVHDRLLDRPFFLDKALRSDIVGATEAATIASYFTRSVGLEPDELESLADAAYQAYDLFNGRTMPEQWLRERVDDQTYLRLVTADALRSHRQQAWFTHHLLHDFLAARWLKRNPDQWRAEAFHIVTLRAASFDALRLAVEQLTEQDDCDRLVRNIYDWNYYGAAYSLVEGFVSETTRSVVLAMLADKKWDPVWATVVQVTDALRFDGSSVARRLLGAKDRIALFRILQEIQSDETWFRRWVELFTTPDQTAATPQMIEQLHEDDSVTSWTLANVLRRCTFGASVLDALIVTASDSSAVVRWRTVHVLGAHPSPRAFEAVQARITDEDQWVQYGAARSAVEMAALTHDPAMRPYIISALIKLAQSGRLSQSALRELSRALDIRPQPPGWPLAVGPLIQQLIGLSQTAAEQDRWGQVMTSIASAESA